MRRPLLLLALLAVVFAAAATADALVGSGSVSPAPAAAKRHLTHRGLRVSARVEGLLYPGARLPVIVRVANRWRRPLTIRRARVWVERAPAGCSAASLQFDVFRGYVALPARRVRRLTLRVAMLPWAQPACQGGVYRLKARARAGPRRKAR
jgi:hypothetical protein